MTDFETLEADWLAVEEALERVLEHARPLSREEMPLEQAGGRALARDLEARVTLPPWDNSAMDGYAVRGDDVADATEDDPVTLRVSGRVKAGQVREEPLREGEAIRIMTGAPVPPGADTVIRVEHTDAEEREDGRVRIHTDRDLGRHIRPRGQDVEAGERIFRSGTTVGSGQVAVLASQGYASVPVHRIPRVAILPTGDELAPLDDFEAVRGGRMIPESNGPTLAEAVRAAGGAPLPLGIARDRPESILRRIDEGRGADVLLTIGGASMGEADLLKRVLAEEGFALDFWRIRIRPGTPFSLGFLPRPGDEGPLPVFGLPGNPASAFVTFEVLVRPFLLRLAGHRRIHRPVVRARAGEHFSSAPRITHFFRVELVENDPLPVAHLTGSQSSGLVQSLGRADALAVVREGTEAISQGEIVDVLLLGEGPGWSQAPPV